MMRFRRALYLKLLFAGVSIALLLWFVPARDIAASLRNASMIWLSAAVVLQFLVRAAATFRMRVVAVNQGLSLSLRQLYRILLASQYYSLFLPGLLAGGAAWVKYIQHGASKTAAAAVVVINRAIFVSTVLAIGISAWVLDRQGVERWQAVVTIVLVVMTTAVLILMPPLVGPAGGSAARPSGILGRLRPLADRLLLFLRLTPPAKLVVVISAAAECLLGAASIYAFAMAVGADIGALPALWIRAALVVMLLLPITVAGLGVREASLVGLGSLLGVPPTQALAWSFAILMGTVIVAAAGGIVEANAAGGRVLGDGPPAGSASSGGRDCEIRRKSSRER